MVRGVLVTWGFVGGIALPVQNRPPGTKPPSRCVMSLPVQNRPPDAELSSGTRMLLVFRCFVLAVSPSGCGRISS